MSETVFQRILQGPALHLGVESCLKLRARKEDAMGPRLFLPKHEPAIHLLNPRESLANWKREAHWATVLTLDDYTFSTPEHLLAALLGFANAPVDIHLNLGEPPIGDGSAIQFSQALESLAAQAQWPKYDLKFYNSSLKKGWTWGDGYLEVEPDANFSIQYVWNRYGVKSNYTWSAKNNSLAVIWPARTFIFYRDYQMALQRGLLSGANPECGLLLAESQPEFESLRLSNPQFNRGIYPILNSDHWRFPEELARHKILDLLGDLALFKLGLPRLKIRIQNGGHVQHHRFLEALIHEWHNGYNG